MIPATKAEDACGIDFFIKLARQDELIAVQVTQRGVKLFAKHRRLGQERIAELHEIARERLRKKRRACRKDRTAFVLIRDYDGTRTNPQVAWGDVKALHYGIGLLYAA